MKSGQSCPIPRIKKLESNQKYERLFSPKDGSSLNAKAGLVRLKKGENIGSHSTDDREEMLLAIDGKGEIFIEGESHFQFERHQAVYIPPFTKHDVRNTGKTDLKYVYFTNAVDNFEHTIISQRSGNRKKAHAGSVKQKP